MRSHIICALSVVAGLLLVGACAAPTTAGPAASTSPAPAPAVAPVSPPPPPPEVAARVDGQAIAVNALDAHQASTGLPRQEALDDLIDLTLLRKAAGANGIVVSSGALDPEARAAAEFELARKLGLPVSPANHVLLVDHAWVKDTKAKKAQAAQRAAIDRLRGLVAAGDSIPSGYNKLGISGNAWHIGDHEEYPYEVMPPAARDLPAGSLTPVIPGDGGLHLFRIIEHKQVRPAAGTVSSVLRPYLRESASIETSASGAQ